MGYNDSKINGYGQKNDEKYVGAPYNFIPFSNKNVEVTEEQMAVHDRLENKLLTGVINYTVEAQTPILVGDGNKEREDFTRDELGRVVIPGSTMRGLIRNNVQVLGLSSFDDDIDDYNLMYRHVANGAEKDFYSKNLLGNKPISVGNGKQMGVLVNVCGGYIKNNHGKYEIYPAIEHFAGNIGDKKVNMSYYVLNERNILDNIDKYPFFTKHKNDKYMQYKLGTEFHKKVGRDGTHYKTDKYNENKEYKPFYVEVSFEVSGNIIKRVDEPGICSNSGFLVGTGKMNEKKALYIIPEKDANKDVIEISESDIKNFKIDFNARKNTLKDSKRQNKGGEKIFNLPEEGEERPVFFISGLDKHTYFGFTPRLRLFYKYKIKDGYKVENKEYDYAKSLFGTTGKEKSYKSKVSFSDALLDGDISHIQSQKIIQAEPKPTSYMDYLKQKKNAGINGKGERKPFTYNTSGFELRGQKQYWLHKPNDELVNTNEGNGNENVGSNIYPLKRGSKFIGKVRFQNLTSDELGLLLWSIKLKENSYMNVGKAKAYGCGVIKVKNISCELVNYEKAYNLNMGIINSPFENVENIDDYIDEYKKKIRGKGIVIDKEPSIKAFFVMKSKFLNDDSIRYMSLDKKEYQNRKALKTIEMLTGEEIGDEIYRIDESAEEEVLYDDFPKNEIQNKTKKNEFKENREYEACVKKYKDGSNVQFDVNNQIVTVRTKKVEIDGQKVTKESMSELLPIGSKCILKFEKGKMIFVKKV